MKVTIQGQDYTAALDATRPMTIERKLNEPSICQLRLSLATNGGLVTPSRNQALEVTGDDGTTYFTGYIAVTPMPEYSGMAMEGPRYRFQIQAVSDELLLDQLLMPPSTGATGETAGVRTHARGQRSALRCLPPGRTLAVKGRNRLEHVGSRGA